MTMGRIARVVAVAGLIGSCGVLGPLVANAQPANPAPSRPVDESRQVIAVSKPTGPGIAAQQGPAAPAPGSPGSPGSPDDDRYDGNLAIPGRSTNSSTTSAPASSAPAPAQVSGPAALPVTPTPVVGEGFAGLASILGTGSAAVGSAAAGSAASGSALTGSALGGTGSAATGSSTVIVAAECPATAGRGRSVGRSSRAGSPRSR
ncbi:hypothetical protein, partial [Nocardia africana]